MKVSQIYPELELRKEQQKKFVVLVICLVGATLSAVSLWFDFYGGASRGQGKPLGVVERRDAKVRRRPVGTFVWEVLQEREFLYPRESIRTGEESAVVLKLRNGTILEIGENSLVTLDDLDQLENNFLSGSLVIRQGNQERTFVVGSDGKSRSLQTLVQLIKPEALSRFYSGSDQSQPIVFSWKWNQKNQGLQKIEISKSSQFVVKESIEVPIDQTMWSVHLKPDRYYWRVTDGVQPLSRTGQFTVERLQNIELTYPQANQKIDSYGAHGVSIPFRWIPHEKNPDVQAELQVRSVNSDQKIKELFYKTPIELETGLGLSSDIQPGAYVWRVAQRVGSLEVVSPWKSFHVALAQKIPLKVLTPEAGSSLEFRPEIRLRWEVDSDETLHQDTRFLVELKGESLPLKKLQTPLLQTVFKPEQAGLYQWRVLAVADRGGISQNIGETEWIKFSIYEGEPITLKAPLNQSEHYSWSANETLKFKWNEDALKDRIKNSYYTLEVAKDPEFKDGFKSWQNLTENELNEKSLPQGHIFWRVKLVSSKGETIKTSQTWEVKWGLYPPLSAPQVNLEQTKFNPYEDTKTPELSWQNVKYAEQYELVICKDSKALQQYQENREPASLSKTICTRKVIDETSFELGKNVSEGRYFYTLRSVDRLNRLGEKSLIHEYEITFGDRLLAPTKILTPEVQ